jgi:glycosyltransferase involved in cell wall biosynthesis
VQTVLISIAIPAFNEEKLLPATLAAVAEAGAAFTGRGWEMEVVVCDNNSTDSTGEIAKAAKARVVFEKENQISRSRNAAGHAAKGEWIVFVDADSTPSERLFAATADLMEQAEVIGGGAVVTAGVLPFWGRMGLGTWNCISRVFKLPAGSYIFCRAKDFRELEGFSTKLYAAEEIEFGLRLRRRAWRQSQRVRIIRHPPLLTSNRRIQAPWAMLAFVLTAALTLGFSLRWRGGCGMWYDGRR